MKINTDKLNFFNDRSDINHACTFLFIIEKIFIINLLSRTVTQLFDLQFLLNPALKTTHVSSYHPENQNHGHPPVQL